MRAPSEKGFSVERLTDPQVIADPYPYYDLLRAQSPVFGYRDFPPGTVPGVDEPEPSWAVLNFDQVQQVARDHDSFSSRDSLQEASSAPSLMLVNHDPPEHTRLRKIASAVFLPSSIRALSDDVMQIIQRSIDEFFAAAEDGESVDVMDTFCAAVPARVMAHLLGMPPHMDRDVRRWATAFMLSADVSPAERQQSNIDVITFFAAHVAEQRAALDRGEEPQGPLLAAFLRTKFEGERLTVEEVVSFCMTVTVAGAEDDQLLLGATCSILSGSSRTSGMPIAPTPRCSMRSLPKACAITAHHNGCFAWRRAMSNWALQKFAGGTGSPASLARPIMILPSFPILTNSSSIAPMPSAT